MEIKLSEQLCEAIGREPLKRFGVEQETRRWQKYEEIDLAAYSPKELDELLILVRKRITVRGAKTVVYDIETWLRVLKQTTSATPRTVKHFYALLRKFLYEAPGHRLYKKDEQRGVWMAYVVCHMAYEPEVVRDHYREKEHVHLSAFWLEFGGRDSTSVEWKDEDCLQMRVDEALLRKGFVIETPELRDQYLAEIERFKTECEHIGKQFFATGVATDDLDGNTKGRDGWWHSRTQTIRLDKNGEPARVVVDVFRETDKEERDNDRYFDKWFWRRKPYKDSDDVIDDELDDDNGMKPEDYGEIPNIEVPLHPMLACFDLRRHTRLRIHISQMKEYIYDPSLGDKLVLPEDSRALVEMLLAHGGEFKDIIVGKGGGAVILCAGPPGTGKTLTAEVYAEVMGRPLYSVQCSQLGTNPDVLEDELLKTFARSQRWNAILLLDEADVYVTTRGSSLDQNAIVGVFLRTLEYYKGVLFLTTNRADLVDDAIASRCVARINYSVPTTEDQKKIWKILAAVSEISLDNETINGIVARHPKLSGRDVKNLLKLALLVSKARKEIITETTIDFVKRFKPTQDESA